MKKVLLTTVIFCTGFFSPICAYADQNFQVVITSDGNMTKLPADWSDDFVVWYIDWYETFLEIHEQYLNTPRPFPC